MSALVVGERRVEITAEVVLGREGAEVLVEDDEVSRRHARVRPLGDALEIEDLGSSNGTWVNGIRISVATRIGPDDDVRIGRTALRVDAPRAQATVISATPAVGVSSGPSDNVSQAPFAPPQSRSRRGAPASRLLGPQLLTYAAVVATAVALLVYFALR